MSASSKAFDPTTDIPDLSNRVAIVTGANSGIGFETAQQLANHGAKVYLAARTESKALDAIQRIEAHNEVLKGSGRLVWLPLDLASVKKSRAAAEEVISKESRLDIIVNNAGQALFSSYGLTEEGISTKFAADHLGHFTFTTTLLPLLNDTAKLPGSDVRVVNVSSGSHTSAPANTKFDSIEDFRDPCGKSPNGVSAKFARHGQVKLANILFAKELQRRWDADGVPALSIALHPGAVASEGATKSGGPIIGGLFKLFFLPPLQGAVTSLFAATSPEVRAQAEKFKGAYLVPFGTITKPSAKAEDLVLAKQLWETSEKVVADILAKGTGA